MIKIRPYQDGDSAEVGKLIAVTYSEYNLAFAPAQERGALLGPFQYADSPLPGHRDEIAETIRAQMVFVAENELGEIVGVLRGRIERLQSLFVRANWHYHGIGRLLVEHFEAACLGQGGNVIRLASTLYAVPFYQKLGYKKSTGVRAGWSFGGVGLRWQPMKKMLMVNREDE